MVSATPRLLVSFEVLEKIAVNGVLRTLCKVLVVIVSLLVPFKSVPYLKRPSVCSYNRRTKTTDRGARKSDDRQWHRIK